MSYAAEVAQALSGKAWGWADETRRRLLIAVPDALYTTIPDLWKLYFDQEEILPGAGFPERFAAFSDYPFLVAALALPDEAAD